MGNKDPDLFCFLLLVLQPQAQSEAVSMQAGMAEKHHLASTAAPRPQTVAGPGGSTRGAAAVTPRGACLSPGPHKALRFLPEARSLLAWPRTWPLHAQPPPGPTEAPR